MAIKNIDNYPIQSEIHYFTPKEKVAIVCTTLFGSIIIAAGLLFAEFYSGGLHCAIAEGIVLGGESIFALNMAFVIYRVKTFDHHLKAVQDKQKILNQLENGFPDYTKDGHTILNKGRNVFIVLPFDNFMCFLIRPQNGQKKIVYFQHNEEFTAKIITELDNNNYSLLPPADFLKTPID